MSRPNIRVELQPSGPRPREDFFAPAALLGCRPVPRLGLGTAGLAGIWGPVKRDESIQVLHESWRQGHLLTDTSPNYADAEVVLGEALASWKGEAPVLLTKLEGYDHYAPPAFAADWAASMIKQFEESTRRFGGRKIDGLAMHDPDAAHPLFQPACAEFLRLCLNNRKIGCAGMGGGGPHLQAAHLSHPLLSYIITFKRVSAVTLQGMTDVVPAARHAGAKVIVASPAMMGLLGSKYGEFIVTPPPHLDAVFVTRAKKVKAMADAAGLPLSRLALRFVLSIPVVDFVLTGACTPAEWADSKLAYDEGPLPADLYRSVWRAATEGEEPYSGG
ncbi:MAG: aldo/keto reductase [Planctomycetes bacterium]|nr:aldo/keto reductase [Planctomycetota bacterium]